MDVFRFAFSQRYKVFKFLFLIAAPLSYAAQLLGKNPIEEEGPRCLSFITRSRIYCVPLSQYASERGFNKVEQETINWSNIVIFMIIHNSEKLDDLIRAHLNTWLRRVGVGLDLVFVSDAEDPRSLDDIISNHPQSKANFRLYKSNAEFDGKHIRFKVIDAIQYVSTLYHFNELKQYFFKMDLDSYLLGQNLLLYLNKLHNEVQGMPIQIGNLMCAHSDVCHAGGAFYGFNKLGLEATKVFFSTHPNIHKHEQFKYVRGEAANLMLHEDFMVSYAFKRATHIPGLFQHEFYQNVYEHDGVGYKDSPAITYHLLKIPELIYMHDDFFYGKDSGNNAPIRSYQELKEDYSTIEKVLVWVPQVGWVFAAEK